MASGHPLIPKASITPIAALIVAALTGCASVSLDPDPDTTDGVYSVHQVAPQVPRHESAAAQQRVSRYTTTETLPDAGVIEPLQAVVQITFPREVRTIEAALDYTLMRSGYSLARPTTVEQQRFRSLPLPESQRSLGPYTVEQILRTLLGTQWQLVINAAQRVVSFVEPPSPAGSTALPTPLSPEAPIAATSAPSAPLSAEPVTALPVAGGIAPSTSAVSATPQKSAAPAAASQQSAAPVASAPSVLPPSTATTTVESNELATAPSVSEPTARWDVLLTDVTLAQTFLRWGKEAGYRVKWDAAKHVLIGAPDTYQRMSFEDAVTAALSTPGIQHSEYPLEACFYPNTPPLVRITRRGEQDKECQ